MALIALNIANASYGGELASYPTTEQSLQALLDCMAEPDWKTKCALVREPNWAVATDTDLITDETTVALLTAPTAGNGHHNLSISLVVLCLRGRIQANLAGDFRLPRGGTRFVHRYDKDEPYLVPWSDLERGGMSISTKALVDLANSSTLTIRFSPERGDTVTAQFKTIEFREAAEHFRPHCPVLPWD